MLQLCYKYSILCVLGLVCALMASPNIAKGQGKDDKKIDAIQKQLKELTDNLKNDFQAVAKDFKSLHDDVKALKENNTVLELRISKALERIGELEISAGKSRDAKNPEKVDIPGSADKKDVPRIPNEGKNNKSPDGISKVLKRIGDLETQVAGLEKELLKLKSQYKAFYPADLALDEIKGRLKGLEKELSSLRSGGAQTSKSSPRLGRILLANSSNQLMLFVVNNTTYRVNPMSSKSLEGVTPGQITYEVISSIDVRSSGRRTTNLKAGETLTLTAS